ncbi:MAG TPA: Rieske (2Fe-2S) protein, partial [Nitrospiria bacterium]
SDSMEVFVTVARTEDFPSGECRVVEVENIEVALINREGSFFAVDNVCPHQGGPLGQGDVENGTIICPWHGWRFNIENGEKTNNPELKVKTYPVRVENGEVKIALK